jgi:hypothetical protein
MTSFENAVAISEWPILVSIGKFGRYLVIYLSLSLALGIF